MKRTGFKPRTTSLPRTPFKTRGKGLNHRSKTKKRPWENAKFRREYLDQQPYCRMIELFPKSGPHHVRIPASASGRATIRVPMMQAATDPHHICRSMLGTKRHDIRANLIGVCRQVHDFCHDVSSFDGTVIALMAKKRMWELDWDELDRICHPLKIRGWLENNRCQFAFAEVYRLQLLA